MSTLSQRLFNFYFHSLYRKVTESPFFKISFISLSWIFVQLSIVCSMEVISERESITGIMSKTDKIWNAVISKPKSKLYDNLTRLFLFCFRLLRLLFHVCEAFRPKLFYFCFRSPLFFVHYNLKSLVSDPDWSGFNWVCKSISKEGKKINN